MVVISPRMSILGLFLFNVQINMNGREKEMPSLVPFFLANKQKKIRKRERIPSSFPLPYPHRGVLDVSS